MTSDLGGIIERGLGTLRGTLGPEQVNAGSRRTTRRPDPRSLMLLARHPGAVRLQTWVAGECLRTGMAEQSIRKRMERGFYPMVRRIALSNDVIYVYEEK